MLDRRRVALIVEMSGVYGRQILEGVAKYQRTHQLWSVFLEQRELRAPPPPWLLRRHWDGIICRSTTPALARAFLRRAIPTVDLNDLFGGLGLPRIASDMRAIGRMGAEHLLERGFRHFAFCGFSQETWSDGRREGFRDAVRQAGHDCAVYESAWRGPHVPAWDKDQQRLVAWLRSLPKPLGLLACNDLRAQQVLNACHTLEVNVPEAMAVVGVDNEEVLCELCDPPLSSVAPHPERIGYEAAALLDQLMAGATVPVRETLIPPLAVIARESSDITRIDDPDVAAALTFIRQNACSGASVEQVVAHVSICAAFWNAAFASTWATRRRRKYASCKSNGSSSFWLRPISRWKPLPAWPVISTPSI